MIEAIRIPEERKAVLIGKDGSVKSGIEKRTRTKINISEDVEIEGEPLNLMKAKDIVKAIGRGFSPEVAMELLKEDYQLQVISMAGETKKGIKRTTARLIGTQGSTKKRIEEETETHVSIYGKTVSIIGRWDCVERAKKAVEMLLAGRSHSYVYAELSSKPLKKA